jgi:predicted DNA-binding transcriptional regulator YafY
VSAIDQTAARLLNLIIALMVHPRGLDRAELMDLLEITEERTFERIKDALRSSLGVALEESEQGHYRLGAEGYAMPPLQFTPPEHAAIALALGAWRGSEVEWAARSALTKLAPLDSSDSPLPRTMPSGQVARDAPASPRGGVPARDAVPAQGRVPDAGPVPDPTDGLDTALYAPAEGASELIAAIAERRLVAFDYVTGATGRLATRHVEPWRLAKRGGAWYLLGFDLDRRAERVYKLGRILGHVKPQGQAGAFEPPDPAQSAALFQAALDRNAPGPAVVRADRAAARVLELQGAKPVSGPDGEPTGGRDGGAGSRLDGGALDGSGDELASEAGGQPIRGPDSQLLSGPDGQAACWRVPAADPFNLAAWGAAIEVIAPESLRERVEGRWRAALAAHEGPARAPEPYRRPPKPPRRQPKEAAPARAARLVSMVSYLRDRGSVPLTELAAKFGVSPAEARRDLYLLWTDVGRSRAGGDLLDFSWSGGESGDGSGDESEVALMDSQGLDRPIRLAPTEAIALIAALRSLEEAAGLAEASAAASARMKLEGALGPANVLDFKLPQTGPVLQTVRRAIAQGRRLTFDYVNQAGGQSHRRVDPLEVFSAGDHWLAAAWDLGAEAERHFRLDRVVAPTVARAKAESHPYRPRRTGWSDRAELVVDAVFAPAERWRAEELETLAPPVALDGGSLQVRLGVVNPEWITAMALGGGGAIEVLGPEAVRERIAEAARAAVERPLR